MMRLLPTETGIYNVLTCESHSTMCRLYHVWNVSCSN